MRTRLLPLLGLLVACQGSTGPAPAPMVSGPPRGSGGVEVVYEIDLERALADKADGLKRDLEARFVDDKLRATVVVGVEPGTVMVTVPEAAHQAAVAAVLTDAYRDTLAVYACDGPARPHVTCARVAPSYAGTLKAAALARAVETIRRRIDEQGVAQASVQTRDDQIVVELPALDDEATFAAKLVIARTGQLELKVVDHGAAYMQRLAAHVAADPTARDAEIRAERDSWAGASGATYLDDYLTARDRRVLERYLDDLAAKDPTLAVAADRELGFERVEPTDGPPRWRTYYLEREAALTGAAIENATASHDPRTQRPVVVLDFNRAGARAFEDLTMRIVDKKLAILLDGTVRSAAVITAPIRDGRASITMGGASAASQAREAAELVIVLKTGALPAPLREASSTPRTP